MPRGWQLLILSVCLLGTILYFRSRLLPALVVLASIFAQGQVTAVRFHSPNLAATGTVNLVSPIHVQATAEDTITVTCYVLYLDNLNVFRNFAPPVHTWVTVTP